MAKIPDVQPGDPLSAERQNELIAIINALQHSEIQGGLGERGGAGQQVLIPPRTRLVMFETGGPLIYPETATLAPYATCHRIIWKDQADEYGDEHPNDVRVYFPHAVGAGAGAGFEGLPIVPRRVWATWNRQSARWEAIVQTQTVWRGTLDGTLSQGSSATVNIWLYAGSDLDTNIDVTAYDWLLGANQSIASGAKVVILWSEDDGRFYVIAAEGAGGGLKLWAKAQDIWQENSGDPRVSCKVCQRDGSGETGDAFWIYLPRRRGVSTDFDPDIYSGDVIPWEIDAEGTAFCTGEYLHSKIGDLRWQKAALRIPTGWQECDSTNSSWDATGRVLMGRDADGADDENVAGKTGGESVHGDGTNDHTDHPITISKQSWGDSSPDSSEQVVDDIDEKVGGGEHLLTHSETDNRMPYKVAILIERFV